MTNVINVDTNRMNGSFLSVKNIIGCITPQLRERSAGMDRTTTVFVVAKDIKNVIRSMDQIHMALSVHMVPHSYSIMHKRINIA